jgi:hypothetical protein
MEDREASSLRPARSPPFSAGWNRGSPDLLEIRAHRGDPLIVKPVHASGAVHSVDHQPCALEEPEVPRDCRPADRKFVGELPDTPVTRAEEFHDRSTVRVAEGFERIAGRDAESDCASVTALLP